MPTVDLSPKVSNVRALVSTKWRGKAYSQRTVRGITAYYVDTGLDTDADGWSIEIADPGLTMPELLRRDYEVRVQLYAAGVGAYAMTGIADEISYDEQGLFRITGRDLSALAIDTMTVPALMRHVRAGAVVASHAKVLGFPRTVLPNVGPNGNIVKKLVRTDGSESYWELWYRLYRREKMWLWTEPDGLLIAGTLNYGPAPTYYLGKPRAKDDKKIAAQYIPIEAVNARKNTQSRFYEVFVGGHRGNSGFWRAAQDPTLRGWMMKRRKYIVDKDAHTFSAAMKAAWDEIFEDKVGAVEWAVTVVDPGFIIKQNKIAFINIPEIGLSGEFFIVGNRFQGGPDGMIQEIRLRERGYALTRRVPDPPAMPETTQAPAAGASAVAQQLSGAIDMPQAWGDYFTKAAKKWCGPWDYNLFLACLLAMCEGESVFRNIRQHMGGLPGSDNIVWYPRPEQVDAPAGVQRAEGTTVTAIPRTQTHWEQTFANEPGVYGITSPYIGVGPMQLTSIGLKHEADDMLRPNFQNQFEGGRWHPEFNIMVAAHYLRTCLQQTNVHDSGRDIDIWTGVAGYNGGPGRPNYVYSDAVKARVNATYLPVVKSARDAAVANAGADTGDDTGPAPGHVNSQKQLHNLKRIVRETSSVDIEHVDFKLLKQLNSLGTYLGRDITITSGFRTKEEQVRAYKKFVDSGYKDEYLAANPNGKGSNHMWGLAVDATVGGVAIGKAVFPTVLARFGLHNSVIRYGKVTDLVHVTLIGVTG